MMEIGTMGNGQAQYTLVARVGQRVSITCTSFLNTRSAPSSLGVERAIDIVYPKQPKNGAAADGEFKFNTLSSTDDRLA